MDGSTVKGNLKAQCLVFMADLYKGRYGAKYLGWPVVRYL